MKVLIGCECSQVECKAFRALGYDAYSCDIEKCYGGHPEWHIHGDLFSVVDPSDFDLAILHPPCTYISKINNWRYGNGVPFSILPDVLDALDFFERCLNYPVRHLAVENPIPHPIFKLPDYTQLVQPYEFGHPWSKATCLWLKNLPWLLQTCFVVCRRGWVAHCPFDGGVFGSRKITRSKSFEGIAAAMALQWGDYVSSLCCR